VRANFPELEFADRDLVDVKLTEGGQP